jgi:magnesium transporter
VLIGWQVVEGGAVVRGDEGRVVAAELEDALAAADDGDWCWLALAAPTAAELARVQAAFGLPDLAVEDARVAGQRPKLERYGDTTFAVLRPAAYDDRREEIALEEVHVFLGDGVVLTVDHCRVDGAAARAVEDVRARLAADPDSAAAGPAAVLHAVADQVVDGYAPVVEGLDRDVDEIEHQVFHGGVDPAQEPATRRIYGLISEVIDFQRAAQSLVRPLEELASGEIPGVDGALADRFRDVADHARQAVERTAGYRDLLGRALDAHAALIGLDDIRDQRRISAWAAIGLVPTGIGGIWGMNVRVPGQDQLAAFAILIALMATASGLLYRRFRRLGWL